MPARIIWALASAGGAFYGHMIGTATVTAQVYPFEPKTIRAPDDGTHVECAAQIVHEHGELDGLFVCDFSIARFLFQVHVAFKAKSCAGAECECGCADCKAHFH